jgi:hypothetical protein
MAKKKKLKPAAQCSEIIEQCVIYAQSVAAFQAGFKVDSTSDFDHAGSGKGQRGRRPVRQAKRALLRLIALSSVNKGDKVRSREEMLAKAGLLSIIGSQTNEFRSPEKFEGAYIRLFANEIEGYFKQAIEDAWVAVRTEANVETSHQANA